MIRFASPDELPLAETAPTPEEEEYVHELPLYGSVMPQIREDE
jgi:hypothetical protein